MIKLIKWFAGFFEDHAGSASSKRACLYISLCFFGFIIKAEIEGKLIPLETKLIVTVIILFCVGAVQSEFFSMFKLPKSDASAPQK